MLSNITFTSAHIFNYQLKQQQIELLKKKTIKKKGEHLSTETNTCNVKTRVQHTKVKIKIMQTCKT